MQRCKRYWLGFCVLMFLSISSFATHNRGGEIMYQRLSGFTYKFIVVIYSDDGNGIADRCSLTVNFGDGDTAIAYRVNGSTNSSACAPGIGAGVIILNDPTVKKNVYEVTHTYAGAFEYLISVFDRNRANDSRNIPNSVNQPFYLETKLSFNNFTPYNNSPIFTVPPIDRACIGKCFYHHPGTYDPDGDSLSYELIIPKGEGGNGQIGVPIPGYVFPVAGAGGIFGLDPVSGLLTWCSPVNATSPSSNGTGSGEYNVAFIVKEWRKFNGEYQQIGFVMRDMQIVVKPGCDNDPPVVDVPADTCVEVGTLVQKVIRIKDLNNNPMTLQGFGATFTVTPPAQLGPTSGTASFTANYSWQTNCSHLRSYAYQVILKVEDFPPPNTIKLVTFKTFNIRVVPPAPKNVTATPFGASINISWLLSTCSAPNNRIISYKIYRRIGCVPRIPGPCEIGVPDSWGYSEIGSVTPTVNTYLDNNNGNGLSPGIDYSYLVVAVYADGSVSYASNSGTNVCARLRRDVPLIINADVVSTNTTSGSVFVRWTKPVVSATNLDTLQLPGPYTFNLLYKATNTTSYTQIYSVTKPFFKSINALSDTTFTHTNLNTVAQDADYKVEFVATNSLIAVGASQRAKTIFLTAVGGERKVNLSWSVTVPWINDIYEIYRTSATQTTAVLVGTSTATSYEDTSNVRNLQTYCYYVRSRGAYSDPSITNPLFNRSQITCAMAIDVTPPCSPTVTVNADCKTGFVEVKWTNPNNSCANDVVRYVLYSKKQESDEYTVLANISTATNTIYTLDNLEFTAACYAIAAIDSTGNESAKSKEICVDNCPEFELPNIVTANGDDVNDFYKAIKVRQIKEINLKIFNRWGGLMYETKDPYFKWDAINIQSKQLVSEGTYFYTCIVYWPTVKGVEERVLKGYMQVVH